MTQRGTMFSKMLVLAVTMGVLCGGALTATADTPPSGKPTLMGMVHVDVAALRKELPALTARWHGSL